ncbi:CLUMA_CG012464, isoform A [Clunio marinus]|uniref:CLUMA_CG012464, isoform A n=1 Tax=Clunio marinus TaxID=568069 RepID=A0A1J1IF05_9DIPT|nr:CLUMA_CG012464, isoform A [Clunio marinus]
MNNLYCESIESNCESVSSIEECCQKVKQEVTTCPMKACLKPGCSQRMPCICCVRKGCRPVLQCKRNCLNEKACCGPFSSKESDEHTRLRARSELRSRCSKDECANVNKNNSKCIKRSLSSSLVCEDMCCERKQEKEMPKRNCQKACLKQNYEDEESCSSNEIDFINNPCIVTCKSKNKCNNSPKPPCKRSEKRCTKQVSNCCENENENCQKQRKSKCSANPCDNSESNHNVRDRQKVTFDSDCESIPTTNCRPPTPVKCKEACPESEKKKDSVPSCNCIVCVFRDNLSGYHNGPSSCDLPPEQINTMPNYWMVEEPQMLPQVCFPCAKPCPNPTIYQHSYSPPCRGNPKTQF